MNEKKKPEILWADGVLTTSNNQIISDFNFQRRLLPSLGNAVFHFPISFAPDDQVSDEMVLKIIEKFRKDMKLSNTQVLAVRHHNTDHEHLHIVANRVSYDGTSIPDSFSAKRTMNCMKKYEKEFGLTVASKQENKRKKELKMLIVSLIDQGLSAEKIFDKLNESGWKVLLNKSEETGRVSGVTYIHKTKGIKWKASQVDRSLSYNKMIQRIEEIKQRRSKESDKIDLSKAPKHNTKIENSGHGQGQQF
jgi:hypothetical protein